MMSRLNLLVLTAFLAVQPKGPKGWLFAIWGIRDWSSDELRSLDSIMGLQPTCSPGVCLSAFPAGDTSDAPFEDYPLAGFCCDPLYWGAIM